MGIMQRFWAFIMGFKPSKTKWSISFWRIPPLKKNGLNKRKNAKFLIVHTSYHGPITDTADVILPSLLWYEQEGSLYNLEGKKVAVRKAVPLRKDSSPKTRY